MNLFDKNENERDIIRELYQQPCKDYLVTFYYHKRGKPKEIQKFEKATRRSFEHQGAIKNNDRPERGAKYENWNQ